MRAHAASGFTISSLPYSWSDGTLKARDCRDRQRAEARGMRTLAVIPARLGATRLPRKPLRLLGGVPLVVRVYERVVALGVADRCVVATDDETVMQVCRAHHVPCVLTAASHPSGTDRVAEVMRSLDDPAVDVVLNVQGDEPFVGRDALVGAVDIVRS